MGRRTSLALVAGPCLQASALAKLCAIKSSLFMTVLHNYLQRKQKIPFDLFLFYGYCKQRGHEWPKSPPRSSIIGTRKILLQANQKNHCARSILILLLCVQAQHSTTQPKTAQHSTASACLYVLPRKLPMAIGRWEVGVGGNCQGTQLFPQEGITPNEKLGKNPPPA